MNLKMIPFLLSVVFVFPHMGSSAEIRVTPQSIQAAVQNLKAGDTLLLAGGLYEKTLLTVSATGKPDAWITLRNAPGERPVLSGKGAAEPVENEAENKEQIPAVIDIRNTAYVRIEGLEVSDSPGYGINVWNSEHIEIKNCIVHDTYSRGIGGSGANLVFESNHIYNTALHNLNEAVFKAYDQGVTRYWSAAAATWYRPDGSLTKNVIWRGNKIHDSWGESLTALHVDGAVLENNEISNGYAALIYIDHSKNVRVNSNVIYHSARDKIRRDLREVSPGIMFAAENYQGTPKVMLENLEIVNNIITNTQIGIGFWRDPSNTDSTNRYKNVTIAHNIIHDSSILPISIQTIDSKEIEDSNNLLANNVVYQGRHYAWGDLFTVIIKNPELWDAQNNLFPNGEVGIFFKDRFRTFKNNLLDLDPQFIDPRSVTPKGVIQGFTPREGSPLAKAGLPIPSVARDRSGHPRSKTQPAIGPFERF